MPQKGVMPLPPMEETASMAIGLAPRDLGFSLNAAAWRYMMCRSFWLRPMQPKLVIPEGFNPGDCGSRSGSPAHRPLGRADDRWDPPAGTPLSVGPILLRVRTLFVRLEVTIHRSDAGLHGRKHSSEFRGLSGQGPRIAFTRDRRLAHATHRHTA